MINITKPQTIDIILIDSFCRKLTNKCAGVSGKHELTTIHLDNDATQQEIASMQAVFDGFDTVYVSSDKMVIAADGVEIATINCYLESIFDYVVFLAGKVSAFGDVNDGILELSVVEPGEYTIQIIDIVTNATGYISITGE